MPHITPAFTKAFTAAIGAWIDTVPSGTHIFQFPWEGEIAHYTIAVDQKTRIVSHIEFTHVVPQKP